MSRTYFIAWTVILALLLPLTLVYLWNISFIILFPRRVTVWQQLSLYQWVAIGAVLYVLVRRFVRSKNTGRSSFFRNLDGNINFLETSSHEVTHTLICFLFLGGIKSFHSESTSGMVVSVGPMISRIPQSLAPYCFPWSTYLLLLMRDLVADPKLWIFNTLVGMSLGFHYICFNTQTSRCQPDIYQFPLWFSFFYIWVMRLINVAIIVEVFFPNESLFGSIWRYVSDLGNYMVALCS